MNKLHKIIFKEFYNIKNNSNEEWKKVYEKVKDHYRWEKEYDLIIGVFEKHKSKWIICDEIGISGRTYNYWLNNIIELAFRWGQEIGLIK